MTITASMICDSVSPQGIRLCTMELCYPKFIHGELMTHRVFSRNASSSRAIPVERLIQQVMDDPVMPMYWGKNRPGMQATEEMNADEKKTAQEIWLLARDEAVAQARCLVALGAHKQIVNRLIEPWCHIRVVVTSTEWANFFALRCHPDAQPEMRYLAEEIQTARNRSTPKLLYPGQWHLPYVSEYDMSQLISSGWKSDQLHVGMIKLSVARCARVSYRTHDGNHPEIDKDLELHKFLVGQVPLHASPAEHQATPDRLVSEAIGWEYPEEHGNFHGWCQYRKMLPNENVRDR